MRTLSKPAQDLSEAERLKQIAKRKEQNRNAQRRLRERKEEYTMQLEAQVAELHRRSLSQEEQSHYLQEMLARIRAENQILSQQLTLISNHVPNAAHRASLDSSMDHFSRPTASFRPRPRSESSSFCYGQLWASPCNNDLIPPQHLANSVGSATPNSQFGDALLSPFMSRNCLTRQSSGQTELTLSSDGSEFEHAAFKISAAEAEMQQRSHLFPIAVGNVEMAAPQSTAIANGILTAEGIKPTNDVAMGSPPTASASSEAGACSKNYLEFQGTWVSNEMQQAPPSLSLSSMSAPKLTTSDKDVGATPCALGISSGADGWIISPWVNFSTSPSTTVEAFQAELDAASTRVKPETDTTNMSLASRRGFDGSLKLDSPVLQG